MPGRGARNGKGGCVALRCVALCCCAVWRCVALYVAPCCVALRCVVLCCAPLRCVVTLLRCAVLLRCVALHGAVLLRCASWRCAVPFRALSRPAGPPSLASCVTLRMQLRKSTQTEQLKLRKFATSLFPGVSARRGPAGRNRVARLRVPSGGRGAPLASPGWPCVQSGDQGALRQRSSHTPGSPRPLRRGRRTPHPRRRALRGTCSPCGAGQSFHMTPREMTGANVPVSDHHRGQCSAFRGPYFFSKS